VHLESFFEFIDGATGFGEVKNNTIEDNVISGNTSNGVAITGDAATENLVVSNKIGTDVNGGTALPNELAGVFIGSGANQNIVGGIEEESRNVISGNNREGVFIAGDQTDGNSVFGNLIGTNSFGTQPIPNRENSVRISGGAKSNSLVFNVISGCGCR